jgi:hypothetical protein
MATFFLGNFSNLPNCRFVELKLVALVSPWALIGFVASCRKFEVEVEVLCRQGGQQSNRTGWNLYIGNYWNAGVLNLFDMLITTIGIPKIVKDRNDKTRFVNRIHQRFRIWSWDWRRLP